MCYAPKVHHLLRTIKPDVVSDAAAEHDGHVWEAFKKILQLKFKPPEKEAATKAQSGLNAPDGGMSLGLASDVKEAAFVASLAAVLPRIQEIATRTKHPTLGCLPSTEGQNNPSGGDFRYTYTQNGRATWRERVCQN